VKPVLSFVEGREASKRRSLYGSYVLVLALAIFCSAVGLSEERVSFQDVEESLTCQCGCGLTVHSCNHLQCPSALPLREEIRAQMDEGKDTPAILAYFSDKYGEKILSAPTTVGFNLVAWVAPFVVIGLGGVFLGVTLKRWSRRSRQAPEAPAAAPPASPYSKILEKELKDFDA
jgi:cytochrome c-type biogenesis protein CcmH/NrfF